MKKRYLLYVGMLVLPLTLSGCSSSVAKLAVESDEVVTIDATAKVNPSDYLKDVAEDAEVNYSISDGVMTITATKGDKSETFEVPVTIEEPRVSIDENITIDTYVGYDIEEYIHEDEGVSHTTNFDEETGELSVTFTKGEWSTTLDSQVEVTSSDPIYVWPKNYDCMDTLGTPNYISLLGNGRYNATYNGVTWPGSYTYDGVNSWTFQDDGYMKNNAYGDYNQFTIDLGISSGGYQVDEVCTLIR